GKGYKNLVMVTLGTGVGGGVIINEKIIPGSDGAAGEIGHLRVKERETETCGCGNHGCLEQYASATGIARVTKKYLEEHDDETVLRNTPE
ncbi:ROK family protein, partial [Staphylococcus epidermidis]